MHARAAHQKAVALSDAGQILQPVEKQCGWVQCHSRVLWLGHAEHHTLFSKAPALTAAYPHALDAIY